MNKYLLILRFLCSTLLLKAQTDTVSNKISKIPYKHVDAIAKFPQGDFKTYITHSLQINHTVEYSIKGQIILLMGIGADGGVSHVSVLKSLSPQIDPEVVQVIKSSPKWKPAMLNNQSISMDMVLNIDLAVNGINPPPAKPKIVKPVVITPPVIAKAIALTVKKTLPTAAKAPTSILVKKPTPIAKKIELPVVKKSVPPIIKKPAPVITKKVEPPVVKKPAPVVIKKQEPIVAKKVVPSVVKKHELVITKKVEPPVVKKPVPVVVKKQQPIVAKKAVPPIIKKAVPVIAKKVVPSVIKKPIPIIAKKTVKPTFKEHIVAKQTETIPAKKPKRIVSKGDFFHPTSNDALFPGGGIPAFFRYLSENIAYPPGSKYANVEGKVFISFTVEEDGSINDVEVESSPAEDLSQEATRVLLASPKWKPANQNGRNVPITYTIPIKFTLGPKAN